MGDLPEEEKSKYKEAYEIIDKVNNLKRLKAEKKREPLPTKEDDRRAEEFNRHIIFEDLDKQVKEIEDRFKELSKGLWEGEDASGKQKLFDEIANAISRSERENDEIVDSINGVRDSVDNLGEDIRGMGRDLESDSTSDGKFRTGGKIPGYGGGDRFKALLEPGEFVINKEAAARFQPMLEYINIGSFEKVREFVLRREIVPVTTIVNSSVGQRVSDIVRLDFTFNGRSPVSIHGQRDEVMAFKKAMQEFERAKL